MQLGDRDTFVSELRDLITGMGQDYGDEKTARIIRCWYKALDDLELKDILPVLDYLAKQSKTLPVPAEVRQMVMSRKRQRIEEMEAIERREKERRREKIPMPKECKEALDKLWASMRQED